MKKRALFFILTIGLASDLSFGIPSTNIKNKNSALLESSPHSLLSMARAEYAKKSYVKAINLYSQISKSSKEYLESKEELGWAYLQAGDWSALRGLLPHLNSSLIPIESRLEGRVLSAIAALHSCDFAEVEKNISEFQTEMKPYVINLERQLQDTTKNKNEKTALQNKKTLTLEAITKMKFVKVELLSQLQRLERYKTKSDVLAKTNQIASTDEQFGKKSLEAAEKTKMVFLSEGDIWPDELFTLKALSQSECDNLRESEKNQKGKETL